MRRTPLLVCAAVAAAGAVLVTAVPAGATVAPGSLLVLTVSDGEMIGTPRNTDVLRCDPIGGDHPHAVDSCSQLSSVNGDFRALPVRHRFCSMIYKPVTVSASGYWRGSLVVFHQTYGNECTMKVKTGTVFEL